ncbi:MAG: hypothetical protein DRJ57_05590 [Thermoprotei archaeon]|nr:MAG: hypothetical protein DRJ57_05590 [Thermoprotei archaeon]
MKIATPIYVHPHQLKGYSRGRRSEIPQMNYPDPWPGGWWRLRDIIAYQKEATYAILEAAAKFREELLYNSYVKARRSIARGRREPPYAFIVPLRQHDLLTTYKLVEVLRNLGILVHAAEGPFEAGGKLYPGGTLVIFAAQPRRALLKKLLEEYRYPDNEFTRDRSGKPIRPYDLATERLPDFMGVYIEEIAEPFNGKFRLIEEDLRPMPTLKESSAGWLLDPRLNDSHKVVVTLLSSQLKVYRVPTAVYTGSLELPPGAFFIPREEGMASVLKRAIAEVGVEPIPADEEPHELVEVKIARIGIYRRLYGGSIDEGWIRWLLDTYGIPYKLVRDPLIREDKLREEIDILILPDDPLPLLKGENVEEELSKLWRRPVKLPPWPEEYRSGFGKEGVKDIKRFVEEGGTLMTIRRSTEILYKEFKLPLRDLTEELKDPQKFFCPGSTLRALVDIEHPLAWGMPREAKVLFMDGPVLEIVPSYDNEKFKEVMRFADNDLLCSGWLTGEEYLRRRPLLIDATLRRGHVYAYAFKPHFRGQTHGTYKLLLNAVYAYRS